MHRLLPEEEREILALFDEWGETDRSHRKLAHRGSYLDRVWVSPSSVRRVLFLADKHFRPLPAARPLGPSPVPGLGRIPAQLHLDLRHGAIPGGRDGDAHHRRPTVYACVKRWSRCSDGMIGCWSSNAVHSSCYRAIGRR